MQQNKQTIFPHPNALGQSKVFMHTAHSISVFVHVVETGPDCVGKKEAGAMAMTVEVRSLDVFFFGLPLMQVFRCP